jgi:pyoluteorin transport system permease protein
MFETLFRVVALARKELLAVLKDPRGRVTLFVPPMLQCLVFGYAATFDLNHIGYAALDQDHSQASTSLLASLDGSGVFERVASLQNAAEAAHLIDQRRALLVVQIGQDFQRRLMAGQPADLQVIADGRNSNTAQTALNYINSVVGTFNSQWRQTHGRGGTQVQAVGRAWYNVNLESRWHIVPSLIATLSILELTLLTAMSVAREREQGTLDQLLVTPFRPIEIMAGKALPSVMIGLVQATVVLLVAQLWFRIPFSGSFVVLYVSLILVLLAAIGGGLVMSMMSANLQQAMLFSFLLLMPIILLSGLFTPVGTMPKVLQYFDVINPLRYAIDIVQRIYLEGVGIRFLAHDLMALALIALSTLSISAWLFRNRLV